MAKQLAVEEASELTEAPARKVNGHVAVAIRHLNKRRDSLEAQKGKLVAEIKEIEDALLALG